MKENNQADENVKTAGDKGVGSSDLLESLSSELYNDIMANREQILKAFIAETGLRPSECEQIWEPYRLAWSVRKKKAF